MSQETEGSTYLCCPEVVQPESDIHLPGVQGQRAREQQDSHDWLIAAPRKGTTPGEMEKKPHQCRLPGKTWPLNPRSGQRAISG